MEQRMSHKAYRERAPRTGAAPGPVAELAAGTIVGVTVLGSMVCGLGFIVLMLAAVAR